jgi:MFS family permease
VTSTNRLGPAYWRVWWAGAVDSVGDGALAAALPLLTVSLTSDPRLVSLTTAATYLPWLLVSLPAGALVDRRPRVRLMQQAQLVQLVVLAVLTAAVATGWVSLPLVMALGFLLGCAEVVFGNAAQAVLPDLVPRDLLARANGNQYAAQVGGQFFVGPPVGSLLFVVAAALPLGVDTVTFAVSAALLARLGRRAESTPPATSVPVRAAIAEGLRWLAAHRLLRTLALLLGVNNFCNQLGQATLVLFATRTLGVGPAGYGLLLAAGAVGSVVGGVVNPRVVRLLGARVSVVAALGVSSVAYLAAGPVTSAVALGVLLAVNGFAITLWNIVTVTLRQQVVPAALLGRVNSVYRMLGWGLIPLGALAGGLVAHGVGLRAPMPVAGAARAVALLAAAPVLLRGLAPRVPASDGQRPPGPAAD